MLHKTKLTVLGVAMPFLLAACGDDSTTTTVDAGTSTADAGTSTTATTHKVGGTVIGLTGNGLVLQNNAGDDLTVGLSGAFTFDKELVKGAAYAITIKTQPSNPTQSCTVTSGTGTMGTADVTSVKVTCDPAELAVGGTVTGLLGSGLVLQDNAGDDLAVGQNGTFAFASPLATGAGYAVTVRSQPIAPSQVCEVVNGTGTIGTSPVTDVAIACSTSAYTVGGAVTGLAGTGLTLTVNGSAALPIVTSGPFAFPKAIASGAQFAVAIGTQPTSPSQTCTVNGGTGTVGGANVDSVAVSCATNAFTVGGTATGLLGTAVLQNNAGDDLSVSANGTFAFPTPVTDGQAYAVTLKTQPTSPSQTCTLASASGNVAGANVTGVALTCVTNSFKIKGSVSGLAGSGLVLQNNAGDDLAVTQNGDFELATAIDSGKTYAVTVKTAPSSPAQTCVVTNGSGTVDAADVTNVAVTCSTRTYTVGGTLVGSNGVAVTLKNSGGDDLVKSADGTFTFATAVTAGSTFAVTATSPGRFCTVLNGSGTIGSANVDNVVVSCYSTPFACYGGPDPGTAGLNYVVCTADSSGAWVSMGNKGGQYHAEQICKDLGYQTLGSHGGTCGNVCGYCQAATSCSARGNKTFDNGGSCGTDALGQILCSTVMWQCLP